MSDPIANAARFRLTYQWSNAKALSLTFEVAPPGSPDGFRPYIKASLHRK